MRSPLRAHAYYRSFVFTVTANAPPPYEAMGVLHESFAHECLKSSLAFRKPDMHTDSRRPARAEGL
jgi:hypothetical protein